MLDLKHQPSPHVRLLSKEDKSVNFVFHNGQEARYVRRDDTYFIAYISSHNGCNMACRFCHLTQTGQTEFIEATLEQMLDQARVVLDYYKEQIDAGLQQQTNTVHFNWMARGEPMANSVILTQWNELTEQLNYMSMMRGLTNVRFNISTIMPTTLDTSISLFDRLKLAFSSVIPKRTPILFYSLYSMEDRFRRRWLPKAHNPYYVLRHLARWQQFQKEHFGVEPEIVLHWAFIHGENDDPDSIELIKKEVEFTGLKARFNLVRYNPYSDKQGEESPDEKIAENFEQVVQFMRTPGSRVVPRVGKDVKASCGMFVER